MMYKVGEPVYLLKNVLSNSCSISFLSGVIGLTIVICLSFESSRHQSISCFICFVPSYGGAKYEYIFKNIFIFKFK